MIQAFDFENHPENIVVVVLVSAGMLFFLCFYCTFIQPVLNCFTFIFKIISRIICCNRNEYTSVSQI